jgi:hypothetical protein
MAQLGGPRLRLARPHPLQSTTGGHIGAFVMSAGWLMKISGWIAEMGGGPPLRDRVAQRFTWWRHKPASNQTWA